LGDIPLLGWLFKSTDDQVRKTNLVVFIRPRIILTPEDLRAETLRVRSRYDTVRSPRVDAESVLRGDFGLPQRPDPDAEPESEAAPEAAPNTPPAPPAP
jgi:type II secretory pathway component GspD/PulD (secretin)